MILLYVLITLYLQMSNSSSRITYTDIKMYSDLKTNLENSDEINFNSDLCQFQREITINESSVSLWTERWFWSCNAKDIGTLYLMFSLFSGLVGTAFSVLIRLELSGPGVQFI